MSEHTSLGPWIRRFLLEHVVAERNLARNTQHSYRDAFTLLIPFVAKMQKKSVDRLALVDLSADLVRRFLADLESSRGCKIATRNQRLAAIRALAGFMAEHSPVHIEWCGQIRSIPFKKAGRSVVPYLEKAEMDALLATPDRRTAQGRRDYALLLFLYNSGARAIEAAQLTVRDLDIRAAYWKGRKAAPLPIMACYSGDTRAGNGRARRRRTRLRQSPGSSDHSIRNPYRGRAPYTPNMRQIPGARDEAGKPAFHSPQHRHPPPPCGR
jgi:integrase/recombinase XerD